MLLILIAVVAVFAVRGMTPDERQHMMEKGLATAREILVILRRPRPKWQAFREALRARTPSAIVTPALVALNVVMFALIHVNGAAYGDPAGLLAWGASFGPRTTNGEWWRIITSMAVEPSTFLLIVNIAALSTVGPLLERYVGSIAFLFLYLSAGMIASLVNLWSYPIATTGSASGPIFGLYGALIAAYGWSLFNGPVPEESEAVPDIASAIAIPWIAIKLMLPPAILFALCNMAGDGLAATAELAAFGVGCAGGLILTAGAREQAPATRTIGITAAMASFAAVALAVPVRQIADVRPEMARVVALEDRTAAAYRAAYDRFTHGRMAAQAVAQVIDRSILPDLQAADGRLKALAHVPPEHQPLVANAEEYVRLRSDSWRLRAQALRAASTIPSRDRQPSGPSSDALWRKRTEAQFRTNQSTFGNAEARERASLDALSKIKP